MLAEFERLASNLRREHPSSEPKLIVLPSGAAMIDVKVGSEPYVFAYFPGQNGFGISRRNTAVFGWEGVEHEFRTFQEAESYLLQLFRGS
jgi:hypothetical protein